MSSFQITLLQIDNYGPWTVSPAPRREPDLQTLQSQLYADVAEFFGNHGGLAFFARFDNMVAISNGVTRDDHVLVQESIGNRYPVTLSLSIGTGASPVGALATATRQLQAAGSAQDADRREVLVGEPLGDGPSDGVQIAQISIQPPIEPERAFTPFVAVEEAFMVLMRYLTDRHESLTFFGGRDTVIVIGNHLRRDEFEALGAHVEEEVGTPLSIGVGVAAAPVEASLTAKHALGETTDSASPAINYRPGEE